MSKFIPLSIPNFEGNESKYVNDALEQGWVSTGGAYITKLEESLEEFLNVKEVVACQSGTAALHMSLVMAGVKPGDMVIVPALTFIAAVNPVSYQFAEPVFMDCDDSLCMDPVKLREFCENECEMIDKQLIHKKSRKHVKAVVVVHVFGNLADMEQIMSISDEYRLKVIEDATEALGTKYTSGVFAGKYAGTIGDFGAYSFNGNKIITTGGGGAVTAKKSEDAIHMRYLSTQAKDDPLFYIHNEVGYNYRMTNLQAALGVAQMELLNEFIKRKQRNYRKYCELLKNVEFGTMLSFREGTNSNMWFYSFKINMDCICADLKQIISELSGLGIQTRAIWGLICEQMPYKDSIGYKIEKAKYYSQCILNIPCSTQLNDEEIDFVAQSIKEILEKYKK